MLEREIAGIVGTAAAIASGPVGWGILLGAEESSDKQGPTWDCWKKILHDHSPTPSSGKPLCEVGMTIDIQTFDSL